MARKIAVLGGGMAALTAAYELAVQNELGKAPKFEITVYQMGWRLGGKGASGINEKLHGRIEEHGLHIWFGSYQNAFRTMRAVYAERPDKWPCSVVVKNGGDASVHGEKSIEVAFRRQQYVHLMEERRGEWLPWRFNFPVTGAVPGEGNRGSAADLIKSVQRWLFQHYLDSALAGLLGTGARVRGSRLTPGASVLKKHADGPDLDRLTPAELAVMAAEYKAFARGLWQRVNPALDEAFYEGISAAELGFGSIQDKIDDARRAWELFDMGQAVVVGAALEGIVTDNDWNRINDVELRDWLSPHLIKQSTLKSSAVTANYDLFFSYPQGRGREDGKMEAGSAARAALWILTTYTGAVMWRMKAGMGDAIFAPLYNALTKHGVKFRFFHKVTALGLSEDRKSIATITLDRQVTVSAGPAAYQPLAPHGDPAIDCWPHVPDFGQLVEGAELAADWDKKNYNLESDWSGWQPRESVTLHVDTGNGKGDFHEVILGIPIAALPRICRDLTSEPHGKPLETMFKQVQTVRTQAFQLWLNADRRKLKMPFKGDLPLFSTFYDPIDTYADMSHLIEREEWPANLKPKHIAYFCGVLEDDPRGDPPQSQTDYPARVTGTVEAQALEMFDPQAGPPAPMYWVWPGGFKGRNSGFDWSLLCGGSDSGRFFRANIDLTERYVLALPGTSVLRLKADQSGFSNLVLAGDWTGSNALYLGCIEGTVISGMQAARAVSGKPLTVLGEGNLFR